MFAVVTALSTMIKFRALNRTLIQWPGLRPKNIVHCEPSETPTVVSGKKGRRSEKTRRVSFICSSNTTCEHDGSNEISGACMLLLNAYSIYEISV